MSTLNDLGLDKNLYKITEKPAIISDEVQSESIIDGEISGNLTINKGFLENKGFISGATGWRLSDNGDLEANNGTFRGTLVGNTINIPDSTTPLFSIDSLGNATVQSLKRRDFHWFTMFESLDGFFKTSNPTEPLLGYTSVYFTTGGTSGGNCNLTKLSDSSVFTFTKRMSFKYSMYPALQGLHNMDFGLGNLQLSLASTETRICFSFVNTVLYSVCCDGSSVTTSQIGVAGDYSSSDNLFSMEFVPGVAAYFYINNTLVSTITTNLPTADTSSFYIFGVKVITNEDVSQQVELYWYDFWQAL